jgi:hypothetical protein
MSPGSASIERTIKRILYACAASVTREHKNPATVESMTI